MQPRITFFCELGSTQLEELFSNSSVLENLVRIQGRVSLGLVDMTPMRAGLVHRLNAAGIPVDAWLLLPREQGYWLNASNSNAAEARYEEFKTWTAENNLHWEAVGLDIEPDIGEMEAILSRKWGDIVRLTPTILRKAVSRKYFTRAHQAYAHLADQIRTDGYRVESYQFPVIADERLARSSLLRRLTGVVDIAVDREVWMLYTSFLRPGGVGMLWSYAPQAQAIGLGSTGGGVNSDALVHKVLSWDELKRDLRLAWHWCNDLYIFSLEGCVQQGFLERMKDFAWDHPILFPEELSLPVRGARRALQTFLWIFSHLGMIFATGLVTGLLVTRLRKNRLVRLSD